MRIEVSDHFRRHAAECKRMAKSAHDTIDKATWDQMAVRWLACAEYYSRRPSQRGAGRPSGLAKSDQR
jgi:hypothetical protein